MSPARRVLVGASALSAVVALVMAGRLLFGSIGISCRSSSQLSFELPPPASQTQNLVLEAEVVTHGLDNCRPSPSAWDSRECGPTMIVALILALPPLLLVGLYRTRAFGWLYAPVLGLLLLGSFAGMTLPVFFAPAALPLLLGLLLAGLLALHPRGRRPL